MTSSGHPALNPPPTRPNEACAPQRNGVLDYLTDACRCWMASRGPPSSSPTSAPASSSWPDYAYLFKISWTQRLISILWTVPVFELTNDKNHPPTNTRDKAMFKTSDYLILSAALLSFALSVSLWFGWFGSAQKDAGIFVGIWVPSILGFGTYFKTIAGRK